MRWGRLAIPTLVVLPVLLAFAGTILSMVSDPSYMLWEGFRLRMWMFLILPSASAASYAASLYAKHRGRSWARPARALAAIIIMPSLLVFYLAAAIVLLIVIQGGSLMVWM